MPSYDYNCTDCDTIFELFHMMTDDSIKHCPQCNSTNVEKLISGGAAVIVKGTQTPCYGGRRAEEIKEIKKEKKQKREKQKAKAKENAIKNPPWWRPDPKVIDTKVLKNPKKYIETGEVD